VKQRKQRLTDSVETSLRLANGVVGIEFVDEPAGSPARERRYSERLGCPNEHELELEELEPRQFSFNAPWGACPACSGLGTTMEVDPDLIVPDDSLTLAENAVSVWSITSVSATLNLMQGIADAEFSARHPVAGAVGRARELILLGRAISRPSPQPLRPVRTYTAKYGSDPLRQAASRRGRHRRCARRFASFMRESPAPSAGERLAHLAVRHDRGRNIAGWRRCPSTRRRLPAGAELTEREAQIAERVVKEINERLRFLLDVGLDYLSLSRPAGTLSGGEAAHRLATQIGSGLVGVLYVLDGRASATISATTGASSTRSSGCATWGTR
jgi:excinuclease ABC subunit A